MRFAARLWQALTWRHWAWALGLGVVVAVLVVLQTAHITTKFLHLRILYLIPWYVVAAVTFTLAVGCVEASERRGHPSFTRYVAAAAIASAVFLALVYLGRDYYQLPARRSVVSDSAPHVRDFRTVPKSSVLLTNGCEGVLHGWLAVLVYARLRSLRIAQRALDQAEMERAVASRDLLDTQLRSAQATVDPEKVLVDLDEIERLYAREPAAAEARLDELIAFLRSAIPRLRTGDLAVPAHAQGDPR